MKIKKWVTFEDEIEINIDSEDINIIFSEDIDNNQRNLLININRIAEFLKGIPDNSIKNLPKSTQTIIVNFFKQQSERFEKKLIEQ